MDKEELCLKIAEYCENDIIATEKVAVELLINDLYACALKSKCSLCYHYKNETSTCLNTLMTDAAKMLEKLMEEKYNGKSC